MAGVGQNENKKSGQQTPRRWGWGTPLKKRAATRMRQCYILESFCQLARKPGGTLIWQGGYIVAVTPAGGVAPSRALRQVRAGRRLFLTAS